MSADWERIVARALTSRDPVAALRAASRNKKLSIVLRKRLSIATMQEDGVRLSALLIARLRFERLIRGSRQAEDWYLEDPEGFTTAFKQYHHSVPPRTFFPQTEAIAWSKWLKKHQRLITRIA